MIDWTPEAIEAAHRAMFQEPYDGTTAAMIGAGLDAAVAAQGMPTDSALREENARLREALKPFADLAAAVEAQYENCLPSEKHLAGVKYGHLRTAAAALKETGDE